MRINIPRVREAINAFDWHTLFIEELGWSRPAARQQMRFDWHDQQFEQRAIAQLAGVMVFEIRSTKGAIPDARTRLLIGDKIGKQFHKHRVDLCRRAAHPKLVVLDQT
jgi:hypothetical protein